MRLILFSKLCVIFSLLGLVGFLVRCMDAFSKFGIFEVSRVVTASTIERIG
jgi:hypothetical protein